MEWKVRYVNYPRQFRNFEKEYMGIIREVLSKGDLILRKQLETFEVNLAKFCGTRYAVGVSNCTDALYLSLYAAGIGRGDEVITVSHTFVATVAIIHHLGAKPVFVDITDDHNMEVNQIEQAITPKTKAIVPVHLNGRICSEMARMVEIARRYNLIIIEDAAQALGATFRGKKAGSFGLTGCFSFYPAKLLGAFGDGGAIVTDDEELAKTARVLRNHGKTDGGEVSRWGFNCRMDNLQSALLDFKLGQLPAWINRRREIAGIYHRVLSGVKGVLLPPGPGNDAEHYDVFQNYEIEAENRDELVRHLNRKGIEIMLSWGGKGVHQFTALGMNNCTLSRTEEFFKKCLMLPMYPELEDEQVIYVGESVREFYHAS